MGLRVQQPDSDKVRGRFVKNSPAPPPIGGAAGNKNQLRRGGGGVIKKKEVNITSRPGSGSDGFGAYRVLGVKA